MALPQDAAGRRIAATWRDARVVAVRPETAAGTVLRLAVPDRVVHRPGQHYVLRLRAADGYTAARSYSVVSAPDDELVEFFVDRVPDGEVSGHLTDVAGRGDELEVRGPIGRWFAWAGRRRAVAVGGGSGVAPVVSMLRHARALGRPELVSAAVSGWSPAHLPYHDELRAADALVALTRVRPPPGTAARLDAASLAGLVDPAADAFVCGSARFAAGVETALVAAGQPADTVRVERFGPTGPDAR